MPLSPLKPKTQIENLAQIKTYGSINPMSEIHPKTHFLEQIKIPLSNNKPRSPNPYNTNGNLISKCTYKAKIEKLKREGK